MAKYSEAEIAAEEERFGGTFPDELRRRFLEGVPEAVVLKAPDGSEDEFYVWGHEDSGDLAVLLRDGTLAWWHLRGGELSPVEIDWFS